ncbi:hypothetical protein [Pseudoalteromonas mariniglutinosa]|uniref:hypothetical protein n=1 Tax=Pseudoalteromonas mariniglutinosa TaxID=206042 RepID=UPI00384FB726
MKKALSVCCLLLTSFGASAGYSISASAGKSFNQSLTTKAGLKIELEDSNHFAFSIDKTLDSARYGLYYSSTTTDMKAHANQEIDMQYLLFQSAVDVPLSTHFNSYVGAQLGVNHISNNFTPSDTYFASGLFAGVEYLITPQARLLFETRWLATIVNNASKVSCSAPAAEDQGCLWHFDGDVLNQFQTSVGFSYRF